MDLAVAALDFTKAGAILADMVESYLAAGASPFEPEGADNDDLQDCRSTSVTGSLHLHSSVDDGAGPLQPGEHGAPIQSGEQSPVSRLESGADPGSRPGSRPVRRANDPSRRLQGSGQRCRHGASRCDLLPGSLAPGALEPRLASPARVMRHHGNTRDRQMVTGHKCGATDCRTRKCSEEKPIELH